ncbi:LAQU0S04e03290g1_1 [Lachancea quebecensis]|uniref:LAQU0S04e03290g1_1 n=1 Tax=Lachancea quebecensis TaxID=1654605 RepID=A0A0P1KZG1_9SACH|nr:LAQU0S04e03290g1_1 [Lachancea quebecensis]
MTSLENAITGAVASSLANVLVYPLDVVKTLIQTQNKSSGEATVNTEGVEKKNVEEIRYKNTLDAILKILKDRGIGGLYRGLPASIVAGFLQSFSYFFWYSVVRKSFFRLKLLKGKISKFSTPEELLLGIVAAAVSQVFTSPIGVISTRQQTLEGSNKTRFVDVVRQIYKEQHNITGFWRGLKVSLILTINPSITFASYERLKDIFISSSAQSQNDGKLIETSAQLSPAQNFALGFISKMISTLITQPLIISKAYLQRTGSQFQSFQQVLYYLYTQEGFLALWKGIAPQLCKGLLVQGLLFMFKGELTKLMRRLFWYMKATRRPRLA